jgi:hypothetical protein
MPRHNTVKVNGANGQTGGKNRSSIFVLTAFISFGLLNIFHFPYVLAGKWKRVEFWISILKS